MATRLYPTGASASLSQSLYPHIPRTENSSVLPGTATLNTGANPNICRLSYTGSVVQPSIGPINTLAISTSQVGCLYICGSERLKAQTFSAATWSFQINASESNITANAFINISLYIWNPVNNSVRGYIYDSTTNLGTEFATSNSTISFTFSGNQVSSQNGDILVLEVWYNALQGMSTTYNISTQFYDSNGINGSGYLETNQSAAIQFLETTQSFIID